MILSSKSHIIAGRPASSSLPQQQDPTIGRGSGKCECQWRASVMGLSLSRFLIPRLYTVGDRFSVHHESLRLTWGYLTALYGAGTPSFVGGPSPTFATCNPSKLGDRGDFPWTLVPSYLICHGDSTAVGRRRSPVINIPPASLGVSTACEFQTIKEQIRYGSLSTWTAYVPNLLFLLPQLILA